MNIFKQRDCLTQEEIRLYLQEKLPEQKAHEIENHLLDCPLCTDALEGYASINSLEVAEKTLEKTTIPLVHKEETKQITSVPPRRLFLRIAAAAMLLLLPFIGLFYWYSDNDNRLYADYIGAFDDNMNELATRSNYDTVKKVEAFYRGLQTYDAKKYRESVTYFRTAKQEHPNDLQVEFFHGLSLLKAGETQQAMPILEKIMNEPKSGYSNDATWYLALAHLKIGNTDRTESLLSLLISSDNYYNKKAATLLQEL